METKLVSLNLLDTEIKEMEASIESLKRNRENALNEVVAFQEDILKRSSSLEMLEEEREMIYKKFPGSRPVNNTLDGFEGFAPAEPKKKAKSFGITLELIKGYITANNLQGSASVKKLLGEFEVEKLFQLATDDYTSFYEKLTKLSTAPFKSDYQQ